MVAVSLTHAVQEEAVANSLKASASSSAFNSILRCLSCRRELESMGDVRLEYTNYSGTERVCFFRCPDCNLLYRQTHYYDPFEREDERQQKIGELTRSKISEWLIKKYIKDGVVVGRKK